MLRPDRFLTLRPQPVGVDAESNQWKREAAVVQDKAQLAAYHPSAFSRVKVTEDQGATQFLFPARGFDWNETYGYKNHLGLAIVGFLIMMVVVPIGTAIHSTSSTAGRIGIALAILLFGFGPVVV